jgi:hypothetical protein
MNPLQILEAAYAWSLEHWIELLDARDPDERDRKHD